MSLNQKGVVQYFLIFVLFLGLGVGLYLVQQRTNLLPKAYNAPTPPEVISECTYAPEAIYNVHVKALPDQTINIKSNCTNLNAPVNSVGSLLYAPYFLFKTGIGDRMPFMMGNLEDICKATGYSGPICKLCRQTLNCEDHQVNVGMRKIEELACQGQSVEKATYNFSGLANISIYAHLEATRFEHTCLLDIKEQNIKVDISATFLDQYSPLPD